MRVVTFLFSGLLIVLLLAGGAAGEQPVRVGSKAFTESVILGEMATLLARHAGYEAMHVRELGGTRVLWNTLRTGEIDAYPEYTGTMREELFAGEDLPDDEALRRKLAEFDIAMTEPLGFNNTYAIAVTRETAKRLGLRRISDLRRHPELRMGFSNEFLDRGDGWRALKARYGLPQTHVRGMQHMLAYRALVSGSTDVVDAYSTDPHIRLYDLVVLEDDLGHFPRYDAVFLYRRDAAQRAPRWIEQLRRLEGLLDDNQMQQLNERVEMDQVSEQRVAADFLRERLGVRVEVAEPGLWQRLAKTTVEHLLLVVTSLTAAILVAVPAGIVAAKRPAWGQLIVGGAEIVQTIPGLALLIFLAVGFARMKLPTIGALPVIVALFLYSLLPIIRNTMAGIAELPGSLKESALALGLTPWARLRLIELPMASRMILAGIKTTAVINVGYAALGGLIGAGGYGQPIMTGLRLNSHALMMEGAVPAAVLALLVKWLFEWSERWIVPAGLRISSSAS